MTAVMRIPLSLFLVTVTLLEPLSLALHPMLQDRGAWSPPLVLYKILIIGNDHRNRTCRTVRQMRFHNVEILIARQNAQVKIARAAGEFVDKRKCAHGVATPVFAQYQQVPSSAECFDAIDKTVVDRGARADRLPEVDILLSGGDHFIESPGGIVACFHKMKFSGAVNGHVLTVAVSLHGWNATRYLTADANGRNMHRHLPLGIL